MRRVAESLGAGTMTLYHYVRNKDELVTLMIDAVMGEVLVPDGELPADWREAMSKIARRSRDAFRRHRWMLDEVGEAGGGPNVIATSSNRWRRWPARRCRRPSSSN